MKPFPIKIFIKRLPKDIKLDFYVILGDQKPNSTSLYDYKFSGSEFEITQEMARTVVNLKNIMILIEGRLFSVLEIYLKYSRNEILSKKLLETKIKTKKFKKKELFSAEHVRHIKKKFVSGASKEMRDYYLSRLAKEQQKYQKYQDDIILGKDQTGPVQKPGMRKKAKRRFKKPSLPNVRYNKRLTKTDYFKPEMKRKRFLEQNQLLETKIQRAKNKKRILQIKKMERIKLITMRGDLKLVFLTLKKASDKEEKRRGKIHKRWLVMLNLYAIMNELKKAVVLAKMKKQRHMREVAICVWVAKKFHSITRGKGEAGSQAEFTKERIQEAIEGGDSSNIEELKKQLEIKFTNEDNELVNQRKCGKFVQTAMGFQSGIMREKVVKKAKERIGFFMHQYFNMVEIKWKVQSYRLKRKTLPLSNS